MKNQKTNLDERFKKYPELQQRVESLLEIVEDAKGDLDKANAAEERVIQELQQMGREVIEQWAKVKEKKQTAQYLESNKGKGKIKNKGKKNLLVHDLR